MPVLGVRTLVLRKSYGRHDKHGHSLDPVTALVNILPRRRGDVYPVEVRTFWCPKCNQYFLMDDDFLALKQRGIICCRIDTKVEDNRRKGYRPARYMMLQQESLMHSYGYNVNADNDLSELDRQDILAFLVENHVMSTQEIAEYLEFFINFMGQSERNASARRKWQADLKYMRNYHRPTRKVKVDAAFTR